MDIEQIRELVQLMVENDLSEIDLRDGENRVSLKRGPGGAPIVSAMPSAVIAPAAAPQAAAPGSPEPPPADDGLITVTSPMVGTFYAAPAPDADPFVKVGAEVDEESVVCIIEAMKVMNEIKAELRGAIAKILVNNGEAVEYGQPMFLVRPS